MNAPQPTGRLDGDDLVITRRFRAPIDDVWEGLTNPDSTARWFGPWRWVDAAGPGHEIVYTMIQEEGAPEGRGVVVRCEPPRHLAIETQGDYAMSYELTLAQAGDVTTLTFVHHLSDRRTAGDFGPGWEFYLDLYVHLREGRPFRKFDEYYPPQKPYYLDLADGGKSR